MDLSEAIQDIQRTRRSQTFVFAGKAHSLKDKLEWLRDYYENQTIKEILEGK